MDQKTEKIERLFAEIMDTLGLDLKDDSLRNTPKRVAKMYVNELFKGLDSKNFPKVSTFENQYNYNQMLIQKNITMNSLCEHHFVPFIGYAHIAYIPKGKVIGLSKLNRITDYFASRPQVQEKLTQQIHEELKRQLETDDVAVVIDAKHLCVKLRGVKHDLAYTRTSAIGGAFYEVAVREELFNSIGEINDRG